MCTVLSFKIQSHYMSNHSRDQLGISIHIFFIHSFTFSHFQGRDKVNFFTKTNYCIAAFFFELHSSIYSLLFPCLIRLFLIFDVCPSIVQYCKVKYFCCSECNCILIKLKVNFLFNNLKDSNNS